MSGSGGTVRSAAARARLATRLLAVLSCVLTAEAQLTGVLDDCLCDIESIDDFNTFKIFPKIQKLQERDYFRYYKMCLTGNRGCIFD